MRQLSQNRLTLKTERSIRELLASRVPLPFLEAAIRSAQGHAMWLFGPAHYAWIREALEKANPLTKVDERLATSSELAQAREMVGKDFEQGKLDYPPLFDELIDAMCADVADAYAECHKEICAHASEIAPTCLGTADLGEVLEVTGDAGDPHNHWHTVSIVRTSTGRFVYKPRDCRPDAWLMRVADELMPGLIRVPRCLAIGSSCGFFEYVPYAPAEGRAEAKLYYRRLGALLAVFHALGSTDCHRQNVMASASWPVPVDLETLLYPRLPWTDDFARTHRSDFERDIELSLAFGPILVSSPSVKLSPLTDVDEGGSAPVVDGRPVTADEFVDDVIAGFEDGYTRCQAVRDQLAERLGKLHDVFVRVLPRNTSDYGRALLNMGRLESLASRETRRDAWLRVGGARTHPKDWERALICAEGDALCRGEFPAFYAKAGELGLWADGREIHPSTFLQDGISHARERLRRMNDDECAFECGLIRGFLDGRFVSADAPQVRAVSEVPEQLGVSDVLAVAEEVFDRIVDNSLSAPSGQRGWIFVTPDTGTTASLRPTFGQGTLGIGIFAQAIAATTASNDRRQRAKGMINDLLRDTQERISHLEEIPQERLATTGVLGLNEGLGGMLRGCVTMSRLGASPQWLDLAKHVVGVAERVPLESVTETDLYTGASGMLLELCWASDLLGDGAHPLAHRLADHLLEQQTLESGELRLWDTLHKARPISGAGHGMAGIGSALCAAAVLLEDDAYASAGADAWRFERSVWSQGLFGWPDLRVIGGRTAKHGFCSGAPGIGSALLLLAGHEHLLEGYGELLDLAISSCLAHEPLDRDHLCCGNAAALEFLLSVSPKHAQADACQRKAWELAATICSGYQQTGRFHLRDSQYRDAWDCDLLYGAAGVGYELLRLAHPWILPALT